ncbi:unnamed protein product [Jaminaea pallidilutea]
MFTKRKAESSIAPTYSRSTRAKTRAGMDTRSPFAVKGTTATIQNAASFAPALDEEGADAYEAERMANIQRNANLMLSMGLTAAPAVRVPRPKPSRPTSLPLRRSMRRTDSDSSGSSALSSLSTTSSSDASSITVPQTPDSAREPSIADETNTSPMCIEEGDAYEAQRIATIKANADLLASLGFQAAERDLSEGPATRRTALKTTPTTPKKSIWDDMPRRRSSRRSQAEGVALKASSPSASSSSPLKTRDEDFVEYDDDGESSSEEDRAFNSRVKRFARGGRTRGRQAHYAAAPLRRAARLGTRLHDPKVFGSIPGVSVGDWWAIRMHCSTSAVHAPTVSGISGNSVEGCFSICLSGGYEDDVDDGDRVLFTGSGGRDLKGTPENRKNLRTAPQSCDQTFSNTTNASLLASMKNGRPIRVVRGFRGKRPFSPPEGYVYSGLYTCTQAWSETGQAGFKVCRFELKRCEGQLQLPTFRYVDEGEQEEEEEEDSSQNLPTLRAATPISLSEEESEVEASICSEGVVPPAQARMQTPQSSSVVITDGSSSDSETDFEEITSREFQSSQVRPRRSARKAAKLSPTPKHTNERPSMPRERGSAAQDGGPRVSIDVSPASSPSMQWFVVLESPNRIREADLFRGWQ